MPHPCGERIELGFRLALEPDMGKELDIKAKLARFEQCPVTGNVSILLESPDPPQAGRRRKSDAGRQLDIGYASIYLKFLENLPVYGIKLAAHRHRRDHSNKISRMREASCRSDSCSQLMEGRLENRAK